MKQIFIIGVVLAIVFFAGRMVQKRFGNDTEVIILEKEKVVEVPIPDPMEWFYQIPESPVVDDDLIDWDTIMLDGVKYFEGYFSKKYYCSAGKLTIGYGSSNQTFLNKGFITREEAERLLMLELEDVRVLVKQEVSVKLNANQLNALTSFTFNCGLANLRQLINREGRLNDGNYASIEKYMPMYRLSRGKPELGLERRRAWEVSVWQGKAIPPSEFKTGIINQGSK